MQKIVLAYSGGLDTSAIIPWLKENYKDVEVYALVADVGQERSELEGVKEKALYSGATDCVIVDLKEEFVKNYIYPTILSGAIYEGTYLLGTSMARPVIAKALVDYAKSINATAIAHGATGKGNDQVRFEYTINALAPDIKTIAPWREWNMRSRGDLLDYLASKKIKTTATKEKIYSKDANAWHISTEGGVLEDPANFHNDDCFCFSVNPKKAPNESELVEIEFKEGFIVSVNNKSLSPYESLQILNDLGAKHGVGRIDIVENRLIGMKSRGCYETPGGTIINTALRALEQLILDRDSMKLRTQLGLEMSYLVYDGKWFCPTREAISAAIDIFAKKLTGKVILELYKGSVQALSKVSSNSLYNQDFATFDKDDVYNQKDAAGFIKIFSLSAKIRALNSKKN